MGFWFTSPALKPDEAVQYQVTANTFQHLRSVGGKVTVTDQRIIFSPNRLDALTWGRSRSLYLEDVLNVRKIKSSWSTVKRRGLGASVRDQIEISGSNSELTLTVADLDRLMIMINSALLH